MDSQSRQRGLTISIAIVRSHFLSDTYMLDDTKCNIPPFTEQFDVVVTIMLRGTMGKRRARARVAWKGMGQE